MTVSFSSGKIHSIIGRSGAGKSTLIRCLNFLESFDSGQLNILGQNTQFMSKEQRRQALKEIGSIFQKVNLLSRRTALENVMLPQEWQGVTNESAKLKAKELLAKVGLSGFEDRYPAQLSGGQCQRVAIARALANEAKILLCDEFTSALDPETSLEILALLRQLNKDLGVTIILITHDMNVVREISDFVYVMDNGKIVEQSDVEQLLLHPQHATTQSLLTGLFVRDLPHHLQQSLIATPGEGQIIVRLIFSSKSSQNPVIAELIQHHQIPINILAGSMDHLRATVFGTLLISAPYDKVTHDMMMAHFSKNGISAEVLGYLPVGGTHD
ncbi:methionine ABC transporter ATP-binding protein [Candidatus Odyssella acanthamoebae]|uniref:methionine ABC transporter ATP-binding protein n=1 Tax=Candidatus Odyssella acanthamoebae TaxID=91604 RepID=UPI0022B50406|nr:methionine ABC transporter ATP-binding protein [Candidatus Paracaedibacter acanthamoebae]